MSRSAVREALSALKAMGLIEIKQGSGTFVKSVPAHQLDFPLSTAMLTNKQDIAHLLEVRKIIEVGARGRALQRTDQDIQAMVQILEDMKQAHGDGELGEKADYQFHAKYFQCLSKPLLTTILDQISGLMIETMKETRRIWLYSQKQRANNYMMNICRFSSRLNSKTKS